MAERVEDLNLPNSVVTRIIKDCVPAGVNVSKEARTAIARAASVFVLYLTSASNNVSMQSNRKTISANDVFKALEETEFDMFIQPLKDSLEAFKKSQLEKKLRAKKSDTEPAKTNGEEVSNEVAEEEDNEEEASDDEEPDENE
ncbi:DNA polymerase epsilon subunit 3 [Cimex lectularius]|uniref:DNA polymerase epsilon subunit 3 n=1 Tax=Cimex lectularius TaxID=79782 RepID=A0A8I6TFP1_CIMLE|nr:DNA polymerase epsilon subunit 3 [Cimex lectularius]